MREWLSRPPSADPDGPRSAPPGCRHRWTVRPSPAPPPLRAGCAQPDRIAPAVHHLDPIAADTQPSAHDPGHVLGYRVKARGQRSCGHVGAVNRAHRPGAITGIRAMLRAVVLVRERRDHRCPEGPRRHPARQIGEEQCRMNHVGLLRANDVAQLPRPAHRVTVQHAPAADPKAATWSARAPSSGTIVTMDVRTPRGPPDRARPQEDVSAPPPCRLSMTCITCMVHFPVTADLITIDSRRLRCRRCLPWRLSSSSSELPAQGPPATPAVEVAESPRWPGRYQPA